MSFTAYDKASLTAAVKGNDIYNRSSCLEYKLTDGKKLGRHIAREA